MIQHIVAWDFPEENKLEAMRNIKHMLEALPALIPEIQGYEVGINIKDSENAKDMVLISGFENQTNLQIYTLHPEHQRVVKMIRESALASVVVDYESGVV